MTENSTPRSVIEQGYVYRFEVPEGATLEEFMRRWGGAYVVRRSFPMRSIHPPTLEERARAEIEAAANIDLERAGRSERVRVLAALRDDGRCNLVLQWEPIRPTERRASLRPEDAADGLWPVIVGGRYADVVEAFRAYGSRVRTEEREACAAIAYENDCDTTAEQIRARGHTDASNAMARCAPLCRCGRTPMTPHERGVPGCVHEK